MVAGCFDGDTGFELVDVVVRIVLLRLPRRFVMSVAVMRMGMTAARLCAVVMARMRRYHVIGCDVPARDTQPEEHRYARKPVHSN